MKKTIRITAAILVLAMLFLALAACSDSGGTASDAPGTGGAAAKGDITYPLAEQPIELSMWLQNNGKPPTFKELNDIMDFDAVYEVESRTGVVVDYVTVSAETLTESFPIMIASNDYCDMIGHVISCYTGGLSKAYEDEIIINLSEYVEKYSPNYYEYMTSDAKTWAASTLENGELVAYLTFANTALSSWGMAIRQDWLAELNMQAPATIDQMHDTLLAFRGQYGATHALHLTQMSQMGYGIVSAWDVPGFQLEGMEMRSYMYQVDGVARASLLEDGYRDYLATMNQWYKEGLISQDFASMPWMSFMPDNLEVVLSDNAGVFYTTANQIADYAAMSSDPNFSAVGITDPSLKEGDTTHFTSDRLYKVDESLSISTDCPADKIEYAMKWIDWWYTKDGINLKNYGIENEVWKYNSSGEIEFSDLIWDSEYKNEYSYTSITSAYIMSGAIPCGVNVEDRLFVFYDDATTATLDAWNKADGDYFLPTLSFTNEENTVLNSVMTDMETFAAENIVKFITGSRSIDTWDSFVSEIKNIGMADVISIYQAALDRFNAKAAAFKG